MPDDLNQWIARLFIDPDLAGMGHAQGVSDQNLGLGWIYYGLARLIRPRRIVVIGSYRGFAPMVFGRALVDNDEGGRVIFIDPSLVDDFWADRDAVAAHFAAHGLNNIDHYQMTTQEFAASDVRQDLGEIGILMVDGYHTEEQARFDHTTFSHQLAVNSFVLFHDSVRERISRIYGPDRPYTHTVTRYVDELRANPEWQVLDIHEGDGLSLVRRAGLS